MIAQILFSILALAAFGYAGWQFFKLRRNIMLGKPDSTDDHYGQRWRDVLLVSFGQKKMFKKWIPAVFHFFIYAAFLLTQIELIEILIDGVFGQHRFFASSLGGFYTFLINFVEILSILAFVATVIFLARRNLLKIPRFHMPEMIGWPKLDGNLILIFEILLLIGIFSMNGADILLQQIDPAHYPATGTLAVSSWLGPALFGSLDADTLMFIERFGWWLHIIMVFIFLNYLPKSKHLHIVLAFPNTYYSKKESRGQMANMPEIMTEVQSMMGLIPEVPADADAELPEFGAKDVGDLSWKTILGAYACTECGRCTSVCPANQTGKLLSPRKIVMNVRDRAEEIGLKLDSKNSEYAKDADQPLSKSNFDDGRSLFDYITAEELNACTACNACVEACPVLIDPLHTILEMRRYEILTQAAGPAEWLPMFNSLESSGNVWQMPTSRGAWAKQD